jgi:hypothetical protein
LNQETETTLTQQTEPESLVVQQPSVAQPPEQPTQSQQEPTHAAAPTNIIPTTEIQTGDVSALKFLELEENGNLILTNEPTRRR